ncbi:MAG TPA: DUF559 domain-containing protein, partial [Solirubrobacteraceae bacterium]
MGAISRHGVASVTPDRALAALAALQHDVFTLAQLGEVGVGVDPTHARTRRGRLHRIHPCVYSLAPPELLTRRGSYMAAVLACGPQAVLSHRSAADLLELRKTDRPRVELTIPHGCRHRHEGIEVHRSRTLDPALDIAVVHGIPCTTVARTVFDLSAVLARRSVERAIDQAEVSGVLDASAVDALLSRHPKAPGAKALREIRKEHEAGSTVTWSHLEELMYAACLAAGVPKPEVNVWIVPDEDGPALRPDFVWRDQRLIVETDGWGSHGTQPAFERDRHRDQRLTLAGWRVVRITWRQLVDERERIAQLLAGLL